MTVTGVDDWEVDGNQTYWIFLGRATSADPTYNGVDPDDVTLVNLDDDVPGRIVVTPTSGLTTSEAGGTATFTVVLGTRPESNVSMQVFSGDATEGAVSTSSLLFTPANWGTPQTVAVTGVADAVADGNVPYYVVLARAASTDPTYNALDPDDVQVTNLDAVAVGILVVPASGLVTTEAGGTASLHRAPQHPSPARP